MAILANILLLVTVLVAVGAHHENRPETIVLSNVGSGSFRFAPAGVAWDEEGHRFIVSSLTDGTLRGIDGGDEEGQTTAEVTTAGDDSSFDETSTGHSPYGTTGVYVEEDTFYACVVDHSEDAWDTLIYAFDKESTQKVWGQSLVTGVVDSERNIPHWCNDLTGDGDGNLFAVDSYNAEIWTVRTDGSQKQQFSTSTQFTPTPTTGLGLTGIVHHPDGYLIAVHHGGYLFKILTEGDDEHEVGEITRISVDTPLSWPVAIALFDGNKILVTHGINGESVIGFWTEDDFESVETSGSFTSRYGAQALANWDGTHYVLNGGNVTDGTSGNYYQLEKVVIDEFASANGLFLSFSVVLAALISFLL